MKERENPWLKNSIRNLCNLSLEKDDFKKSLLEWEFSGFFIDYIECIEVCQLCEKDDLRYHFEIKNIHNNSTLLVGSKCIEKFDIRVLDEDGNEVTENKEQYLMNRLKKEYVLNKAKVLKQAETKGNIDIFTYKSLDEYCLVVLESTGVISPKMLNYMFLRFEMEGIAFEPKHFSTDLRIQKHKEEIIKFNDIQFERIKPALTKSQIEYFEKHRFNP